MASSANAAGLRGPLHLNFGSVLQQGFAAGELAEVIAARVTVSGMTGKGGILPTDAAMASPLLRKSFTVRVAPNSQGLLSATIWLTGFGAVRDVRVDALTYADGSIWRGTAQQGCHAVNETVLLSSNEGRRQGADGGTAVLPGPIR